MHTLSVIILGIIQGIAEFLPISSSAHLIIFRDLFGIGAGMSKNMELAFDVALHLGTLLAIAVFFFNELLSIVIKGFTKGVKDKDGKIMWYLVAATIPAAIFGVLFEDIIEGAVRSNYILIALALSIMGIIIYLADKFGKQEKELSKMNLKEAIIIGCSQVFALIPGFSRSGTTIAAARVLGIKREDAAKFSFFLSAPVVLGAVTLQLLKKETLTVIMNNLSTFSLGILISFITGLICIKFLLKYLHKHNFKVFMIYYCTIFMYFIILCFIGYIVEIINVWIYTEEFTLDRGFLIGPYLPIYGMGSLIMTLTLSKYKNDIIVIFVMSMVLCCVLEFLTSYILEKIFGVRWWDYTDMKYNLDGRICLENALLFGLAGVIVIKVVNPILFGINNNTPDLVIIIIGIILSLIFIIDLISSVYIMTKLKINTHKYSSKDSTKEVRKKIIDELYKHNNLTVRLLRSFPNVSKNKTSYSEYNKLVFKIKDELKKIKVENKYKKLKEKLKKEKKKFKEYKKKQNRKK